MNTDIVIVNWNAGSQLRDCIDSILQYGQGLFGKIIVVDNGSTDGSAASIADLAQVTLLRAGANLGFGKGCNLGAMQATSDLVLFLNPDTRLFPESLSKILECVQQQENAGVGIFGLQLIDERGHIARSCARFPSSSGVLAHAIGLDLIAPKLGPRMTEWDHQTTRTVDQVMGAFFLVRRDLFQKLNGFDERFFVYFEEVDFSYRAREQGWSSMYLAGARAFHAGGGTSRQIKARRLYYSLRSRVLYFFKHTGCVSATMVLLATLFVEPLFRCALAVKLRSWNYFRDTMQGYGMFFRWLMEVAIKHKANH